MEYSHVIFFDYVTSLDVVSFVNVMILLLTVLSLAVGWHCGIRLSIVRDIQLTDLSIISADCEYQDAKFEIIVDGFEVMLLHLSH